MGGIDRVRVGMVERMILVTVEVGEEMLDSIWNSPTRVLLRVQVNIQGYPTWFFSE